MLYLRFNDERKKLLKAFKKDLKSTNLSSNDLNEEKDRDTNESLAKISEQEGDEEDEMNNSLEEDEYSENSEDYNDANFSRKNGRGKKDNGNNIFNVPNRSNDKKISTKSKQVKQSLHLKDKKDLEEENQNGINIKLNKMYSQSDKDSHMSSSVPLDNPNQIKVEKNSSINAMNMNILGSLNKESINIQDSKSKLEIGKVNSKSFNENPNDPNNLDQLDQANRQINKKLIKKIELIMEFLDKINYQYDEDPEKNPKELLKRLKHAHDFNIRNDLIDRIESLITDILKKTKRN